LWTLQPALPPSGNAPVPGSPPATSATAGPWAPGAQGKLAPPGVPLAAFKMGELMGFNGDFMGSSWMIVMVFEWDLFMVIHGFSSL